MLVPPSLKLHIYSLDMDSMLRLRYVLIDKVAYFVGYHQIGVVLHVFCLLSQQGVYVGFIPRRLHFHASSHLYNC
jgi:hypothetical protein